MQRPSLRPPVLAASLLLTSALGWSQSTQQPAEPAPAQQAPAVPAVQAPAQQNERDPAVAAAVATKPEAEVDDPTMPAKPEPDLKGKKVKGVKKKKEKAPKLVPVTVEHGVLTVDGWTGKADLNYQIPDFHFFYIWSPGLGTVVISNQEFKGAKFQAGAFDGGTLSLQAEGHSVQLASEHKLLISKKPEGAYVLVDPDTPPPGRYPQVGYGLSPKPPYSWPGALANTKPNSKAPPLPEALRPSLATTTKCDVDPTGKKTNCHDVVSAMYLGKNDKGELKQSDLTKDPSRPAPAKSKQ